MKLSFLILAVCLWAGSGVAAETAAGEAVLQDSVARLKQSLKEDAAAKGNAVKTALSEPRATEPESLGSAGGRILRGLGLCLGVLFIGVALLRRLQKPLNGKGGRLEILERLALSPKSALVLLRVDGQNVLVAHGSDSVSLVHTLPRLRSRSAKEKIESKVSWKANADMSLSA